MQAPRVKQAVGKDMAPLWISTKLDFIHSQKIACVICGHRLDCADPILHAIRNDAFLARDQRDHGRAAYGHDAIIDFARQEAQRQANHASAMRQHPLDGVMGFARIGGA